VTQIVIDPAETQSLDIDNLVTQIPRLENWVLDNIHLETDSDHLLAHILVRGIIGHLAVHIQGRIIGVADIARLEDHILAVQFQWNNTRESGIGQMLQSRCFERLDIL
jgi:hypothetical protein